MIVDLEWRSKKPRGKYHADRIDEESGIAQTREKYIIDEDLYDMISAARPSDQPTISLHERVGSDTCQGGRLGGQTQHFRFH